MILFIGRLRSPKVTPVAAIVDQIEQTVALEPEPIEYDDFTDIENDVPTPADEPVEATIPDEQIEESPEAVNGEPTSVREFRVLANLEFSRLTAAKAAWEDVMSEESDSIPDVALNSIRVATGKCGLLLAKKFPFFSSLIDLAEASIAQRQQENVDETEETSPQQNAGVNDLLGMWEIIANEIADIDGSFDRLRRWREVSGWALEAKPKTPSRYGNDEKDAAKPAAKKPTSRLPRAIKNIETSHLTPTIASKMKAAGQRPLKVYIPKFN